MVHESWLCIHGLLRMAGFNTGLERSKYLDHHKVPHTQAYCPGVYGGNQSWANIPNSLAVCRSVLPEWAPALEYTLQSLEETTVAPCPAAPDYTRVNNRFVCNVCSRTFGLKGDLNHHYKNHTTLGKHQSLTL